MSENNQVKVIFLAINTPWPLNLGKEWEEIREAWQDHKGIFGVYLGGSFLRIEDKVVGGLAYSHRVDGKSKRKVMDVLRGQGLDPEIIEESPL